MEHDCRCCSAVLIFTTGDSWSDRCTHVTRTNWVEMEEWLLYSHFVYAHVLLPDGKRIDSRKKKKKQQFKYKAFATRQLSRIFLERTLPCVLLQFPAGTDLTGLASTRSSSFSAAAAAVRKARKPDLVRFLLLLWWWWSGVEKPENWGEVLTNKQPWRRRWSYMVQALFKHSAKHGLSFHK